jgi:crotonobetainyl-CoA:carnitine CoA-transferase CaiB-like acyl-CoA transferase
VKVLELVDDSAEYCGRLLAGLGLDVIKLEPPEGAPSRRRGPFVDGTDDSLHFRHYNVGKGSVVVRADDDIRRWCQDADVLIHTLRHAEAGARGLDPESLLAVNRDMVICAITPFGQSGPWAEYEADDLVLMALGGSMAACGYGPADPPLACYGDQAWHTTNTYAAIAILAALWWRDARGEEPAGTPRGQFIDVSGHECSASMTEWHVMTYLCTGQAMPRFSHGTLVAADGRHVCALTPDFLGPHVFRNLVAMLEADGVAGPLSEPAFADPAYRSSHYGEVYRALKRLAERHDADELYRLGQAAGLPWGVVRAPEEVLDDPHLRARGHFVEIDGMTHTGAPFLAERDPFRLTRGAPKLGADG